MRRHAAALAAFPLVATALHVSGCAHPDPPLLSLAASACTAQPHLGDATPVAFDRAGVTVSVGAGTACLNTPAGPATYAAFLLPPATAPYAVMVESLLTGDALLSPHLAVLDKSGATTRVVPPERFRASVTGLTAGLRLRPADSYLVVAADPATLGKALTLQLSDAAPGPMKLAATTFIPIVIAPQVPPQNTHHPAVLSLNGRIHVSAGPVTTVP